jgi:hypothetical protein
MLGWSGRRAAPLAVGALVAALLAGPAAAAARPTTTAAILRAGVITAHDVPSTWISTPRSTGTDPFPSGAACQALAAAERVARRHAGRAASPQFSDPQSGNTTQADDDVYAFTSAGAAHRYLAAYLAGTASGCFQLLLTDAVGASATATIAPLAAQLVGLGDENAGYEGMVQGANGAGQTVALVADIVAVRVGRAVAVFEFLNANTQITAGPTIVNTVVKRLGG